MSYLILTFHAAPHHLSLLPYLSSYSLQMDMPTLAPRTDELKKVSLFTASDWWDGPVRGLAMWREQFYWFAAEPETSPERRWFGLFQLRDDELAAELTRHQAFEQAVGTHWCFHLPRDVRKMVPGGQHASFYQQPALDRSDYTHPDRQLGRFNRWANSLRR